MVIKKKKKTTLYFVNVRGKGTISQHRKKSVANTISKRLKNKGYKPYIVQKKDYWTY